MSDTAGAEASFHFASALLPSGWTPDVRVTVRDGLVHAVAAGEPAEPSDERHAIALPGVPNLHSHAFQRGMAGLAELRGPGRDSFWTWRETMYRFVDRITPQQLQAIAALAYLEMLESGFTRVGEFHYLHHAADGGTFANPAEMSEAIAAAAEETGIALTLLPVFYAHGGFGGAEPEHHQRRFINDPDGFSRLLGAARTAAARLPDAVVGVAPHSLRAVTPDELRLLEHEVGSAPIHIHVAEQTREVEDCLTWSGARPVEWLLGAVPVDERWCLVHATHVTDVELASITRSGAVVGLCPITEANLGDGIFPAASYLEQQGRFGIGSDSNVLIDMTEELRLLEYGQRLSLRARCLLASGPSRSTGHDLFEAAVRGGAQALGASAGIAVGNPADFLSLSADHPGLVGRSGEAILDSLIFAGGRAMIDCVWRRGKKVVNGGHHTERARIEARYRSVLGSLLE